MAHATGWQATSGLVMLVVWLATTAVLVAPGAGPQSPTPLSPQAPATTFAHVGALAPREWAVTPDGYLFSQAPYSEWRPAAPEGARLALSESPGAHIDLVVRDDDRQWHEAGYLMPVDDPNGIHPLHRWLGAGSGAWRDESFDLSPGVALDGSFYVSAGTTLRSLGVSLR